MSGASREPVGASHPPGDQLRSLFEAAPDAIFIVDPDGSIVDANHEASAIFGFGTDELIGQPIELLVPEGRRATHARQRAAYLEKAERRPMGLGLDLVARRRDGSTFPVDITLGPIETSSGSHVIAIVRDMTERRRAEEELSRRAAALEETRAALKERNTLLSSILESMGEAVAVTDEHGRFVLMNPMATRLYGHERTHATAPEWGEGYGMLTPDGSRRLESEELPLMRALRGEHVDDLEVLVRAPGRETTLVTSTARPLQLEDGQSRGAVVVFRDISDRKRAEDELAKRAADLGRANQELESFAYSVSHDLRTPLRAIQGIGRALEEDFSDDLPDQGRAYLGRMVAAAKRMDELILDLLAYSRLGREGGTLRSIDLDAIWQDAREQLGERLQDCVTIREPLGRVTGNRAMLEQVAGNLLANAVKFVSSGVEPIVEVHSVASQGRIRVFVRDNGIGIDPAHHARVFGIFERLHGIEQYPGSGIGLALVKKAVVSMGGTVGVESRRGDGSSFWFELGASE